MRFPTLFALPLAALLCAGAASAGDDPATAPLSLAEAQRLAVERQPALAALADEAVAAHANAVVAAQLPDPKFKGGLVDLTATGAEAGTLRRESDTQFVAGIAQDFPRAEKRRLRGARAEAEAGFAERRLDADRRAFERDAGLAWIETWSAERARALAEASAREAQLQAETAQIAYANGRGSQAELRAARVARALLDDEIAKRAQDAAHARAQLSRWLADDAQRPLPEQLPGWPEPAPLAEQLEHLRGHPHLGASAKAVEIASTEVALAKAAYQPDWSVELGYGYRPAYSDYVNIQFSVDLPVFAANRQDRSLLAKRAELERAEALRDDDYRQHAAELRLNYGDWTRIAERLARYDDTILPESRARIEAARLAWASGSGTLAAVLDARRAALDAELRRLELETDRAKHALALRYLAGPEGVTP
jgi:outer membrane protein TolC